MPSIEDFNPESSGWSFDLQKRAFEQILEENESRSKKKKNVVVTNSFSKQMHERNQRRVKEIYAPDTKSYLERRMLAFGVVETTTGDPDKKPTKLGYDFIAKKNSVNSSKFEETYPPSFLTHLANAWEYDVHIQRALEIKSGLITNHGKGITFTMKPHTYREMTGQTELESLLDGYIAKDTRERLMGYLDNVLAYTQLYEKMTGPINQKMTFGRGAALIRRLDDKMLEANSVFSDLGFIKGSPVYINPLSTMAMERILVDPVSWQVSDVYYNDAIFGTDEKGEDIPGDWISSKDLIYMVNKDYHMLPSRLHYGYSDLVPIMPISETLRQIYSEILTEANANLILPSLMFTFDDLDEESMQKFVDNYRGGGVMGRNSSVGMDKIEFSPNIADILNEMNDLKKILNYGTSIPPIFAEDNNMTNRSVADRIAEVWTITDLIPLQDEFSSMIYDQFFVPTIHHWLEAEEGEDAKRKFIAAKIKVITNFPKLDFADITSKAQYLETLKRNYVISIAEWRQMINKEPFPEDQIKIFDEIQKRLQANPEWSEELLAFLNAKAPAPAGPRNELLQDSPEEQQLEQEKDKLERDANNTARKLAENRF